METIVVAIITGGLSLLGVIITSNKTTRDVQAKLDKQQAVTDTKLDELTTLIANAKATIREQHPDEE